MNRKLIFWVSGCLLLTCASLPLNAQKCECSKTAGKMLEAFFFLNQSKLSIVIPIFHIVFSHFVGKLVFVKVTFFLGNIYDVMCQNKQTNKTLLHKKKSRQQGRLFPQPVTLNIELSLENCRSEMLNEQLYALRCHSLAGQV